jgi:SpoVK/Ycf46/Vps4 family AAA+-type ATPase
MPDVHDLELLIESLVPVIVIQSSEETRVLDTITRLAIKKSKPFYRWTATDGLQRLGFGFEMQQEETFSDPVKLLQFIRKSRAPALFGLCDFHPYLRDDPMVVRLVKDIALQAQQLGHTLIFVSVAFNIPPELQGLTANFTIKLPGAEQIVALVKAEAAAWSLQNGGTRVRADNQTLRHLVRNLSGLTVEEVRRLARTAIVDDGAIDQSDIPEVNKAKFALMNLDGILGFEYNTTRLDEIGGLDNLKAWLKIRQPAFSESGSATPLDPPKGILLLGVQGCGKSLAARAVAGMWNLPCLRLDMGALYNKFFGETERNMREALRTAELMSPCVMWIDEIEKGLGQAQHDEGVSKRVLGTLLTWMSERTHPVFLVATANNIHALPAELIRKGRFDEIFFLDLPVHATRVRILQLHLQKRQQIPADFDLDMLSGITEGFSGAEIEQLVVSALYRAAAGQAALTTEVLAAEAVNTRPLSVVMAEDVAALRHWASKRCVSAS